MIFEAGTGIRALGENLIAEGRTERIDLFLSHTHWDHIQGFPFFSPIFIQDADIHIYGPKIEGPHALEETLLAQMEYSFFPVSAAEIPATLYFHELEESELLFRDCRLSTCHFNHPLYCLGYRVEVFDKVIVYTGDNEPYVEGQFPDGIDKKARELRKDFESPEAYYRNIVNFVKDADLLICDAQYTDEEYQSRRGWGHSTYEHAIKLAQDGNAKRLALFHHDPGRQDGEMSAIEYEIQTRMADEAHSLEVFAAREGQVVELD
jgi:ribonuclease BN (tRNA processing enzyme)